jgi:N-acetylglutamate synthase/N-acetylornithine aminotransferase
VQKVNGSNNLNTEGVDIKTITLYATILKVDGDTSTNDCVIAMASGLSGLSGILSHGSTEAQQFQACLDAVSTALCPLIFAMYNSFATHVTG